MDWMSLWKKLPLLGDRDGSSEDWPSLGEEAKEMLEAAILMYAFADLRILARNGKLSSADEEKLLNLPVTTFDVMSCVKNNMGSLQKIYKSDTDFYVSALSSIQNRLQRQSVHAESGEVAFHTSRLVVFDDAKGSDELVYGIAVNTARRRITVGFRGSVTVNDFIVDAQAILTEIQNPIKELKRTRIYIHHGFREYLLGEPTGKSIRIGKLPAKNVSSGCSPENNYNKYEQIMNQLLPLLAEFPGYRLYATGHSLGGALATLFAFYAAADPRIPKKMTVTCVSVASPKVGGLAFRRAFQHLEHSRRLRCLRIANHRDLITLIPDRGSFSCVYLICCQSYVYRHVGIGLKLYGNKYYRITKPSESNWYIVTFFLDWVKQTRHYVVFILSIPFLLCCKVDFLKYHGCREYMERLSDVSAELEQLELNTIYKTKRCC